MNIAEAIKSESDERRESAQSVYAELLRVAAAAPEGNLSDDDRARFVESASQLGYDAGKIAADLECVKTFNRLTALLKSQRETASPLPELWLQAEAHKALTEEILQNRRAEFLDLSQKIDRAQRANESAFDTNAQLEQLSRDNWELLKLEDPAQVARRRHFLPAVSLDARKYPTTLPVYHIEQAMVSPQDFERDRFDFLPAKGQSQKQLDALLTLADKIRAKYIAWAKEQLGCDGFKLGIRGIQARQWPNHIGPFACYLLNQHQLGAIRNQCGVCLTPEMAAAACEVGSFEIIPIRALGQTEDDFEGNVIKYQKLLRKQRRREAAAQNESNEVDAI